MQSPQPHPLISFFTLSYMQCNGCDKKLSGKATTLLYTEDESNDDGVEDCFFYHWSCIKRNAKKITFAKVLGVLKTRLKQDEFPTWADLTSKQKSSAKALKVRESRRPPLTNLLSFFCFLL